VFVLAQKTTFRMNMQTRLVQLDMRAHACDAVLPVRCLFAWIIWVVDQLEGYFDIWLLTTSQQRIRKRGERCAAILLAPMPETNKIMMESSCWDRDDPTQSCRRW